MDDEDLGVVDNGRGVEVLLPDDVDDELLVEEALVAAELPVIEGVLAEEVASEAERLLVDDTPVDDVVLIEAIIAVES
jgi:hypothetical protein